MMKDNDDLFNAVYAQEMRSIQKGYDDGFLVGQKNGFEEGLSLGKNQGSKVAQELGYYYGFCQTLLLQTNKKTLSKAEQKGHLLLKEIVSTIQKINNYEPLILKDVIKIRSQFKQASTLLKLNKDVLGNYTSSDLTSF